MTTSRCWLGISAPAWLKESDTPQARIQTPSGLRTCFEAVVPRQGRKPLVARFGGIPLRRNRNAVPCDRVPDPAPHRHREIIRRLLRSKCEICGRNAIRVTRTRSPESSLRGNSHGELYVP